MAKGKLSNKAARLAITANKVIRTGRSVPIIKAAAASIRLQKTRKKQ